MLLTRHDLSVTTTAPARLPVHSLAAVQAAQDCDIVRLRALRAARQGGTAPEPGGSGPIS